VDQHAGAEFCFGALQGALEHLGKIHRAVLDHHCTDGQHLIAVEVQAAGFQVQYHPALAAQCRVAQRDRLG